MGRVTEFEQLLAWQKARELSRMVYRVSATRPLVLDRTLREQLRSAAVSAMGNIAEGFDRGGRPEFHQFLTVAKGSAGEVRSHLYAARDSGYLTEEQFDELRSIAREVSALTQLLRGAVARQRAANGRRIRRRANP